MTGRYKIGLLLETLLYSLRTAGWRTTFQRVRLWVGGEEEYYVFMRNLQPPSVPMEFPIQVNGLTVRHMVEGDLDEVARLMPFELLPNHARKRRERLRRRLEEAIVVIRDNHVVGANWYADRVTPEQPWYSFVEPHIIPPARLAEMLFVVPGEKAAGWAMSKYASDRLATIGIRTTVSAIRCDNRASMLFSRLHGAKLVAHMTLRYRFGRRIYSVEKLADEEAFGRFPHLPSSPVPQGGPACVRPV
jgi:hypothetical protein